MGSTSTLRITRADAFGALALGCIGGAAIGIGLQLLWPQIHDADWLPAKDVLRFAMAAHGTGVAIIRPAVLGLIGLAIMGWWIYKQPRLTVSDKQIEVHYRDGTRIINRDQVAGIHRKGQQVIIEASDGRTLFSDEIEGAKKRAEGIFVSHGYPWEMR